MVSLRRYRRHRLVDEARVEDLALDGDAAGDLDGARLVAAVVEDHLVLDLGLLDERVA